MLKDYFFSMNSFFVLERSFVVTLFFLIRINYQKTCGKELTMKKKTKKIVPKILLSLSCFIHKLLGGKI